MDRNKAGGKSNWDFGFCQWCIRGKRELMLWELQHSKNFFLFPNNAHASQPATAILPYVPILRITSLSLQLGQSQLNRGESRHPATSSKLAPHKTSCITVEAKLCFCNNKLSLKLFQDTFNGPSKVGKKGNREANVYVILWKHNQAAISLQDSCFKHLCHIKSPRCRRCKILINKSTFIIITFKYSIMQNITIEGKLRIILTHGRFRIKVDF